MDYDKALGALILEIYAADCTILFAHEPEDCIVIDAMIDGKVYRVDRSIERRTWEPGEIYHVAKSLWDSIRLFKYGASR